MSDTTAAAQAATGDPITAALAAGFAQFETPAPIDNSTPETPEEAPEEVVEVAEEAEEPVETPEEAAEEPETPAEENDEPVEETDEVKILTPEEIEAKFARSNTKEGRAYMAQVSEVARVGQETIAKLGGEPFIEPLAKISTALQAAEADPTALQDFFLGIVEASGAETMLSVVSQAMYMGFVKADDWANNPETAQLGDSLKNIVNTSVEAKWGVSADRMAKLVEWEKVGWLDKLDEWVTNNYVPQSELDEMLEINSNPMLKKLAVENQALKAQKEKATPAEKAENPLVETEAAFSTHFAEQLQPVLTDVVWKHSPLRDVAADTPGMKETKAFLRGALEKSILDSFAGNPDRSKLLSDFQRGKQHTATYKAALANAIDGTVRATKAQTKVAEEILVKLYGKTRNAKIVTPASATTPPVPLPPTVPQSQAPASGPKSVSEVQKNLQQAFEALG